MPTISVLLPARNAGLTLPAAIASVRRQRFTDWECVIVDNGSSDHTPEYLRAVSQIEPRIRTLCVKDVGLVGALQAGLAECRGQFVARMDADDLMHRERLAAQLELMRTRPELGAVGCHVRLFPRAMLTEGIRAYERWLNQIDSPERIRAELFVECPLAHPTLFIRRELLLEFGYRDLGWPEDYDLLMRLVLAGRELGVVPRRLLCWRDSPTRHSRVSEHCSIERISDCKASFLCESLLSGAAEYVLWGYGHTGRRLSRLLAARGKRPTHIVELHPGRVGQRIAGAAVITPEQLRHVPRRRLVVSVAGEKPRAEIRAFLRAMCWAESRDFVCAA